MVDFVGFCLHVYFFILISEAVLGSIIFGVLFTQYDKVSWAAYLFFIPGLVMVVCLLVVFGFFICAKKACCAICACSACCEPGEKA